MNPLRLGLIYSGLYGALIRGFISMSSGSRNGSIEALRALYQVYPTGRLLFLLQL